MSVNAILGDEEDFYDFPTSAEKCPDVKGNGGRQRGNRKSDNHWLQRRSAEYMETSGTSLTVRRLLLLINKTRHKENQPDDKDSKVTCQPNERAA